MSATQKTFIYKKGCTKCDGLMTLFSSKQLRNGRLYTYQCDKCRNKDTYAFKDKDEYQSAIAKEEIDNILK